MQYITDIKINSLFTSIKFEDEFEKMMEDIVKFDELKGKIKPQQVFESGMQFNQGHSDAVVSVNIKGIDIRFNSPIKFNDFWHITKKILDKRLTVLKSKVIRTGVVCDGTLHIAENLTDVFFTKLNEQLAGDLINSQLFLVFRRDGKNINLILEGSGNSGQINFKLDINNIPSGYMSPAGIKEIFTYSEKFLMKELNQIIKSND